MATAQKSVVTPQRVFQHLQSRFNPIRSLTPEILSAALDGFAAGNLRQAALLFDAIEQRDDQVRNVSLKRKKAAARNGYEIVAKDKSRAAQRHKQTLEDFYFNLSCTSAIDRNQRGGVAMLVRQMMDAAGKMYSAHEIIWTPRGGRLTAEFCHVPLWFFENRTGRLQFLEQDYAMSGKPLAEGEWLVTVGDGLMLACSVAYIYKSLALKDWVVYSERHGMPLPILETNANFNSPEWDAAKEAMEQITAEGFAVISSGDKLSMMDLKGSGEAPYPKMVERMDRAIASLWRGADLSTMSAGDGQGQGASLQGSETDMLEADDAAMISETLNEQVDKYVLQYVYGKDVEPLAYFKLKTSVRKDVKQDLEVDRFLLDSGVPQAVEELASRYERNLPEDGQTVAVPRAKTPTLDLPNETPPDPDAAGVLLAAARMQLAEADHAALKPLADRLIALYRRAESEGLDDKQLADELVAFRDKELPDLLVKIGASDDVRRVLEALMAAALANGIEEGAAP